MTTPLCLCLPWLCLPWLHLLWQLELRFDREMRELLDANVAVIKVEFGPHSTLATIQRIRKLLKPWLHSMVP